MEMTRLVDQSFSCGSPENKSATPLITDESRHFYLSYVFWSVADYFLKQSIIN